MDYTPDQIHDLMMPNDADDVPYPSKPRLSATSKHLLRELARHVLDVRGLREHERQSLRAMQRQGLCSADGKHWRITDTGVALVIAWAEEGQVQP